MNIKELLAYQEQGNGQGVTGKGAVLWDLDRKGQNLIESVGNRTKEDIKVTIEGAGNRVQKSVGTENYTPNSVSEEERTGNTDVSESQRKANENLAILTGEDCEALEEEGDSLTKHTREYVERAVERNKEQRAWNARKQEEGLELRTQMRENREEQEALGFAQFKSEGELRQAMENAGIPATPENLSQVSNALEMSRSALEMTDQMKAYLIRENMAPTIENCYQARYSSPVLEETVNWQQEFEDYSEQIGAILSQEGFDDEKGWKQAEWLFSQELPLDGASLQKLSELDQIAQEMTQERVLTQILFTMSEGMAAETALLDDQAFLAAEEAMRQFHQITDDDIVQVAEVLLEDVVPEDQQKRHDMADVQTEDVLTKTRKPEHPVALELFRRIKEERGNTGRNVKIPLMGWNGETAQERLQVTLKRQIEEIRYSMTIQAAAAMEKKGIHIDVTPLEEVIQELRQREQGYLAEQLGELERPVTEAEFSLWQETLEKAKDISAGFAGVLGTGIRQQALLTVNELHGAVGSVTFARTEWRNVYETVQTQVRADLGDSIQKAFENVPSLLEDMGLEATEANQRAVRILGYNRMEITEQTIGEVKFFDGKVNRLLSDMKPSTVLELIRRGENPLNTPIDELDAKLREINEQNGVTKEEKYSRFLWQMEKNGQISEAERSGYVGIYRLLRQIEKSDGVAIGALIDSNRELTLGNLLTQVRSRKRSIDETVDDTSSDRPVMRVKNSITDQIQTSFFGRQSQGEQKGEASFAEEQKRYYHQMASEALDQISPDKLQEMSDGELQNLLQVSLETFTETLKQQEGNIEIQKKYYERLAKELREAMKDTVASEELLEKLSIPATVEHLLAAGEILHGETKVYPELYEKRKLLGKQKEKEFEETIDSFAEEDWGEEQLEEHCEHAEKIMEEVLAKSQELSDINFEELQNVRRLGRGLRLQVAFRSEKSYDIPIRTGDTITSLNLTIIHGAEETGRVQISMEDERFGNISLDFRVAEDLSVKGLVLCGDRQGFDALRASQETWTEEMGRAGFLVKNISYGMDFRSRNELLGRQGRESGTNTEKLYELSKILVRQMTDVLSF